MSFLQRREERMVIETESAEETFAFGKSLGLVAGPSSVYCLNGELGVGKTVFTQGFAQGLGITEPVDSPTFTIQKEYEGGRLAFYHFDAYRLCDVSEMDEIGYEDCFYGEGVSLVEWGGRIAGLLPKDAITVTIEKDLEKGFDYRRITVEGLKCGY